MRSPQIWRKQCGQPVQRERCVDVHRDGSDLDMNIAESVTNPAGIDILSIAYKQAVRELGGEGVPNNERIDAFSFLVGSLASFAMSVRDPKGMGVCQRL